VDYTGATAPVIAYTSSKPPTTLPSTRPSDPDLAAQLADVKTRLDVLRSESAAAIADLKAQTDANTAFLNAVRAAAAQPTTQAVK
jgi:hypothetical protein